MAYGSNTVGILPMGEVLRLAQGWRWLPLLLNPSRWNGRSVEPLVWAVLISGAGGYFLPGALSPITMVTAETGDGGAARAVAIVGQASVKIGREACRGGVGQ